MLSVDSWLCAQRLLVVVLKMTPGFCFWGSLLGGLRRPSAALDIGPGWLHAGQRPSCLVSGYGTSVSLVVKAGPISVPRSQGWATEMGEYEADGGLPGGRWDSWETPRLLLPLA